MIRGARPSDGSSSSNRRGFGHQRLSDRHHLLFAAGQVAGLAVPPVAQHREQPADVVVSLGEFVAAGARDQCTCSEILLNGQIGEQPSSLHHLGNAVADDARRGAVVDVDPAETDRSFRDPAALGRQQPGDRPQHRRLAGTVGTQQCDDRPGGHVEADAAECDDHIAVDDLQVLDRQHGFVSSDHFVKPPRLTFGRRLGLR